jgi:hypothetical protein
MVRRREGASPAKLIFWSLEDRDMERQDISSQELPKCEMQKAFYLGPWSQPMGIWSKRETHHL